MKTNNIAFQNLSNYLNKKIQATDWRQQPIILNWLNNSYKDSMNQALKVIDKKVGYLLNQNARGKLRQWFRSDDSNFCTITAERYVIDYLKSKNNNINDNLYNSKKRSSVDAEINCDSKVIGIEVTTINGFISEWIFTERLPLYLKEKKFDLKYTLEISYDWERINREMQNNTIYNYIENVGENIISENFNDLIKQQIGYVKTNRKTHSIIWRYNNADKFPIFEYLTCGLIKRLREKQKQLLVHRINIVFVGINHIGPVNWQNPDIFRENTYNNKIQGFLSVTLPQNVIGVCYYCYSIDKEEPFYPLKMFWREQKEKITINL